MFKNSEFELLCHIDIAAKASGTGDSSEDTKLLVAGAIVLPNPVEADCVVTEAYVHVLTTVTGATQLDLGDEDDADAFIATASLSAGGKSAATLAKRYSAVKNMVLTVTGTPTAGKLAVVIKGHRI